MACTIVTWNLHGSARPDLDAVASALRSLRADVAALQEMQRRQARSIAHALGWETVIWSCKHQPLGRPAEGLAVLSRGRMAKARTVTLSRRAPPWSYRRRIAQLCTLDVGTHRIRLANCHLASDDAIERQAQAERLLGRLESGTIVVGDLNARPGARVLQRLLAAGLRDAWVARHPNATGIDGATCWQRDDPDERPTRRLDYILVPAGSRVLDASVPSARDSDLAAWRRLSDHLPVRATLDLPVPATLDAPG